MTTTRWQLQEAKNRLSKVVRRAREEGPQVITLRSDEAVVMLDADEYRRLARRPKGSLVDFFRKSPLVGVELDLARSHNTGRDLEL
jgi:antitoxin Phd